MASESLSLGKGSLIRFSRAVDMSAADLKIASKQALLGLCSQVTHCFAAWKKAVSFEAL